MLQQECHLSHPWHDALHHCVPWPDSLFVQTSGSIKNDPQLSQRPSTRSKRQTEVKRQTISSSGVLSSQPVRWLVWTVDQPFAVKSVFPVEWRLQSPKLVQATSKYRYHLIKLCKTIRKTRAAQRAFLSIPQRLVVVLATSWQRPRCPLTRTRAVIWQSVYWRPQIKWCSSSSIFALGLSCFFLVKFVAFAMDSFRQLS